MGKFPSEPLASVAGNGARMMPLGGQIGGKQPAKSWATLLPNLLASHLVNHKL